jgi:hypothetical protein
MPTFYYLAVSGDHRRLSGEIESANEATARASLNKMGLSVLSISSQPPAASQAVVKKTFEFEAVDRYKKTINGTIDSQDALSAYERLANEFKFEVHYLCAADATTEEKQVARDGGIKRLQNAEVAKKALELERNKSIMKMSLTQIVERAEEKLKTKSAVGLVQQIPVETTDEFMTSTSLDALAAGLTDEQAILADARNIPAPIQLVAEPKAKVLALDSQNLKMQAATSATQVADEFTTADFDFNQSQNLPIDLLNEKTQKKKLVLDDGPLALREVMTNEAAEMEVTRVKNLEDLALEVSPTVDLATTAPGTLGEISLTSPLFWKGDADGRGSRKIEKVVAEQSAQDAEKALQDTALVAARDDKPGFLTGESLLDQLNFSFPSFDLNTDPKSFFKALINGSTLPVREAVGEVLTGVLVTLLSVFVLLTLLARYQLSSVSDFSAMVVSHSTLFAFLVFAMLIYRLLIAIHGMMKDDVATRASLLYLLGSVTLIVAGVNLVY